MTEIVEDFRLFRTLEEIDALIRKSFDTTNRGVISRDPTVRFKAYVWLLQGMGKYTPGFNLEEIQTELRQSVINPGDWENLEDYITQLREKIPLVVAPIRPTYTATSYWSPIDTQRHTVYHRPFLQNEDRPRTLARAYAFYALTHAGRDKGLYSLIQYIATQVINKHGIRTCFQEDKPNGENDWWHIPERIHKQVLEAIGIEEAIDRILLQEKTADELEAALQLTLLNLTWQPWPDLHDFAAQIIQSVDSWQLNLTTELEDYLQHLRSMFKTEITQKQAFMMLFTQSLWREACPKTDFMYTFITPVADTCCIITLGTAEPLKEDSYFAMASMSKSLFVHPLLLDYAAKEDLVRSSRRMNIFRRTLGHNLPKFLIYPTTTFLQRLENIPELTQGGPKPEVTEDIEPLRMLFGHYDRFLRAIMTASGLKDVFSRGVTEMDFEGVKGKLNVLFRFLSRKHRSKTIRKHLKLELEIPSSLQVLADAEMVTEMLFNLIANAVDAIHPKYVRDDPLRARIRVTGRVPQPGEHGMGYATLSVEDRGVGFPKQLLKKYEGISIHFDALQREAFWESLDQLIEETVPQISRKEHLGIGLIFCIAYLRSLEWQAGVNRAGHLKIDSEEGQGTTVTVHLPAAT